MKLTGTRATQAIALYNQANDFVADTEIAKALNMASKNVVNVRSSIVKQGYGFRVKTVYCPEISKYCLLFKIDNRGKGYQCVDPIKDPVDDSVFETILSITSSPVVKEVINALRVLNDDYWEMKDLILVMNQPAPMVKSKYYYFTRHYSEYIDMHVRDDFIHPRKYIITAPYKKAKLAVKSVKDTVELVIPIYLTPQFKLLNSVFTPLEGLY